MEPIVAGPNDPIQNLETLDAILRSVHGDVLMLIVASKRLEANNWHARLLVTKLGNYLQFRNTREFRDEFGNLPREKVTIKLCCDKGLDEGLGTLLSLCAEMAENRGATFVLHDGPAGG